MVSETMSEAEAIRAAALEPVPHGFFTRRGGVSTGIYGSLNTGLGSRDDRAAVLENRARVAARLGASALATPYQIHSPDAVVVREAWTPGEGPHVDAVVTDVPGLAVGVSSADCGPILFSDAEAGVVGAAHAGWRGAFGGVLESTLAAMESIGADRSRIVAVLGPTISAAAYEVGPEFRARFVEAEAENARFFVPSDRAEHHRFDLPAYIVARLTRAGTGTVGDLGLCTYADPERFYSYRRMTHQGEADYGRLVAAITPARR